MPFDKAGKHHLSTQKAMTSDKAPAKPPAAAPAPAPAPAAMEAPMGSQTIIDHNDDGSFSVTHSDGEQSGPFLDMAEAMGAVLAKEGGDLGGDAMAQEQPVPEQALMGM